MIEKSIMVTNTGYCHVPIRRSLDGKETKEAEEVRVKTRLEEERKKVPPVYSAQREIIEYYKGRHLDVLG